MKDRYVLIVMEFLNMCKKPAVADCYFEIDVSCIDKDKVAEKALSMIKDFLI